VTSRVAFVPTYGGTKLQGTFRWIDPSLRNLNGALQFVTDFADACFWRGFS